MLSFFISGEHSRRCAAAYGVIDLSYARVPQGSFPLMERRRRRSAIAAVVRGAQGRRPEADHRALAEAGCRCRQTSPDGMTVAGVAVANEIGKCLVPWEGFGDLPRDPLRRRMVGQLMPHHDDLGL